MLDQPPPPKGPPLMNQQSGPMQQMQFDGGMNPNQMMQLPRSGPRFFSNNPRNDYSHPPPQIPNDIHRMNFGPPPPPPPLPMPGNPRMPQNRFKAQW